MNVLCTRNGYEAWEEKLKANVCVFPMAEESVRAAEEN